MLCEACDKHVQRPHHNLHSGRQMSTPKRPKAGHAHSSCVRFLQHMLHGKLCIQSSLCTTCRCPDAMRACMRAQLGQQETARHVDARTPCNPHACSASIARAPGTGMLRVPSNVLHTARRLCTAAATCRVCACSTCSALKLWSWTWSYAPATALASTS